MSFTDSGKCPVCGNVFRLKMDGRLRHHNGTEKDYAGFRKRCRGVDKLPVVPGGES